MILERYENISKLIAREFSEIIISTKGKYSYHWEQRGIRNVIYRQDNAFHKKWKNISTFPKHFHNGKEIQ